MRDEMKSKEQLQRELTEWRRRNAQLQQALDVERNQLQALQSYELMADCSRDIILLVRREDSRLMAANTAAVEAYGYSREELLKLTIQDLRAPHERGVTAEQMSEADRNGILFETIHRRKDGFLFPVEVSSRGATIDSKRILVSVIRDITERRRMQEAIEKRIIALTRPLGGASGIEFEYLFDLAEIQRLQDQFAEASGVASVITRTDGTPITRPSNFCRLCESIIRKTPKGLKNCYCSDAVIGRQDPRGPTIQPCLSGGLWDAGASITVGGRHIANWLIGQVRNEAQDEARMRAYARGIETDEDAFMEAFREVPSMRKEQFEKVAQALFTLAGQLSSMAYQNIQQARFITEQKRMEKELHEREAELRKARDELELRVEERTAELVEANRRLKDQAALLELAQDAIIVRDLEDRVVYWNTGAEKTYGWPSAEALGRVTHDLLKAEYPQLLEELKVSMLTKGHWEGEVRHTTRAGERIVVTSRWALQRDAEGNPAGTLEINRDVTEAKRVEEELRLDEARFEALYTMSRMTDLSEQELIDYALETQVRITGSGIGSIGFLNRDETVVTVQGWSKTVMRECTVAGEQEHLPISEAGVWAEAVRQRRVIFVNDYTAADLPKKGLPPGHVALGRVMSVPIFEGSRIVAVATLANKEEPYTPSDARQVALLIGGMWALVLRKRAEAEKAAHIARLELVNSELQEFAFVASHDLAEPLRKIQSLGSMLREKCELSLGEDGCNYLERMERAAARMSSLLSDLLGYSRVATRTGSFEPLDLARVAEAVLSDLELQIEETGAIVEFEELPSIEADESQMRQLLQNLIGNALKYRKKGEKPLVRVYGRLEREVCELRVEDNGIGFDEKYLDRIFRPFQRLHGKNEYGGTGMGLAIVRKIAERHGGTVTARSTPGRGATFIVTLPLKQPQGR